MNPNDLSTEQKFKLVWKHTHRDYKGTLDGTRAILVLREGGTQLVPLVCLTETELARELNYALAREERTRRTQ